MLHQQRTLGSELTCGVKGLSCKPINSLFGEQFQGFHACDGYCTPSTVVQSFAENRCKDKLINADAQEGNS